MNISSESQGHMEIGHSKHIDLRYIVCEYKWNRFTNNNVLANNVFEKKKTLFKVQGHLGIRGRMPLIYLKALF